MVGKEMWYSCGRDVYQWSGIGQMVGEEVWCCWGWDVYQWSWIAYQQSSTWQIVGGEMECRQVGIWHGFGIAEVGGHVGTRLYWMDDGREDGMAVVLLGLELHLIDAEVEDNEFLTQLGQDASWCGEGKRCGFGVS